MNQTSFKKGSIGQLCVERIFAGKSVLYWTDEKRSHPFDGIAFQWESYDVVAVEIKAKAIRSHYDDTGFDLKQWERLRRAREKFGKDPYCVFVDEGIGWIYGNWLSILERSRTLGHGPKSRGVSVFSKSYPSTENHIVYFPLCAMKRLGDIPSDELTELRRLSQRNPSYPYPDESHYDDLGTDAS